METVLFVGKMLVLAVGGFSGTYNPLHLGSNRFEISTQPTLQVVICCLPSICFRKTTKHLTFTCLNFSSLEVFCLAGSEWRATEY
jgi:hypothetical protein